MTTSVQVRGGFWEVNGVSTLLLHDGPDASGQSIRLPGIWLRLEQQLRQLLRTLTGASAGPNATFSYSWVEANPELGGLRNIVQNTLINRATTAADITFLNTYLLGFGGLKPAVNVPNLDGNPLGTR